LACEELMACFRLLAYEKLMACCLSGDFPSLFACCCSREQFPLFAGVRPAADETRLVAFLRVTVARGDDRALGDAGNRFVGSDPMKVDRRSLVMALSPVATRTKKMVREALVQKVYLTKLYSRRQVHVFVLSRDSNLMPKQKRRVEIECESL
jgi:hypothetical protein